MYDCERNNGKTCRDFICKEPCEYNAVYGACHDRCMKFRVCSCCAQWKDPEKRSEEEKCI